MAPVYEGAGNYFSLEQTLVIFVMWPSALVTLCNKLGQNSCMLVVSQPLHGSTAFKNLAATGIWSCRVEKNRIFLS